MMTRKELEKQDFDQIYGVKKEYPYESKQDYIKNIKRGFFVAINDEAMPGVGFDLHVYHELMKKPHHMVKYKYEEPKTAKEFWQAYLDDRKELVDLINAYFKTPEFKDKKFETQVRECLKNKQYEKIAKLFSKFPDAPEAHWAWRNTHQKHPVKSGIMPEQQDIMNQAEKSGRLAQHYGYQIKNWHDKQGRHCTGVIDKKTKQSMPFDQLPKKLQSQIHMTIALENYFAERK